MEIGQKLPEVLGTDQDGKEWHLSDFASKKLVLYIYPRDATPGCTSEACETTMSAFLRKVMPS